MKTVVLALFLAVGVSAPLGAQDLRLDWTNHPSLRAGKWLRIDFRARVQRDVRRSDAAMNDNPDADDIARRRVGIDGRLGQIVDYQLEYELAASEWRDVYVNFRQFKAVQVQAGKFKVPFSLEETTGATNLDFVYRSRIASRLAPGRDRGVAVHGRVLNDIVTYEAGLFRNDGANARPSRSARVFGGRTTAARIKVEPFHASKSVLADFQAGAAVSTTTVPEGFPAVRARTVLGASFFESDVWVKGRRRRTGLEARWRPGPFSIQTEYIRLSDERRGQGVDDGDLDPLVADGWYVSGAWVITGEEKSDGLDKPRHRFGAVEVTSRVETLRFGNTGVSEDLSRSDRAIAVLGNADHALTYGVNWYLNRWVKVQFNLIRERIHDPVIGPLPVRSSFWSRALRFQFTI